MESIGVRDRSFVWVEYRLNLEAMWVMGGAICIGVSDDGNWPQVDARTTAEVRWQQFKKNCLSIYTDENGYERNVDWIVHQVVQKLASPGLSNQGG
jgi:hypothetical protein